MSKKRARKQARVRKQRGGVFRGRIRQRGKRSQGGGNFWNGIKRAFTGW